MPVPKPEQYISLSGIQMGQVDAWLSTHAQTHSLYPWDRPALSFSMDFGYPSQQGLASSTPALKRVCRVAASAQPMDLMALWMAAAMMLSLNWLLY